MASEAALRTAHYMLTHTIPASEDELAAFLDRQMGANLPQHSTIFSGTVQFTGPVQFPINRRVEYKKAAMMGMLAGNSPYSFECGDPPGSVFIAETAVKYADAMIAEDEQHEKEPKA